MLIKLPCVLLLRAASKEAFDHQEKVCREYAKRKGLSVEKVYRENSGWRLPLNKRSVLRWMRAYCRANGIRYVVALKAPSISHNASEMWMIEKMLGDAISVEFVRNKKPSF